MGQLRRIANTVGSSVGAYGRRMEDPGLIRRRKQRCNRAVLIGVAMITFALWASLHAFGPPVASTALAFAGFGLIMYGVHVGWLVFYDRESDGPPC